MTVRRVTYVPTWVRLGDYVVLPAKPSGGGELRDSSRCARVSVGRQGRRLRAGVLSAWRRTIELGPGGVTAEQVVAVARHGRPARLGRRAPARRWSETAAVVERLADSDEPAYGVSTGFGSLAQTRDPARPPGGAAAGA